MQPTLSSAPVLPPRSPSRPAPRPARAPAASAAGRLASLLFGGLVYLFFLGTFLYAMGFVNGLVVPKTVDDGARVPLLEALLVNGGFLALFGLQHTIMARISFKRVWTRIVPAHLERSIFVLVTCLILSSMFWQWRHLPGMAWELHGPVAWLLRGISFAGWGIVLLATFLIDHFELFGLRQVVRHFLRRAPGGPPFVERSLYRYVRHPLMTGFLIAFWATPVMSMGHLFFAAMCTAYVLVGLQIEERTLIALHGESYRDYRRRVPMLLPLRRPVS